MVPTSITGATRKKASDVQLLHLLLKNNITQRDLEHSWNSHTFILNLAVIFSDPPAVLSYILISMSISSPLTYISAQLPFNFYSHPC